MLSKTSFTSSELETSRGLTEASPLHFDATLSRACLVLPESTTIKPSSDSLIAEASPIPDPAPVIHATLFTMVISYILITLKYYRDITNFNKKTKIRKNKLKMSYN